MQVDSLLSNGWNTPMHNKQLLEMVTAGACIVIPAWEATMPGTDAKQAEGLSFQLASGMSLDRSLQLMPDILLRIECKRKNESCHEDL